MVNQLGFYFEDFKVRQKIQHPLSKTIFESDNNLFSLLTMNYHPVHTNETYAANSEHGKILVVGTLIFSLTVGITVPEISGKAIANLEYSNVKHIYPVFIGDTIHAESEVINKMVSKSKSDRGIIEVHTVARNQFNQPVLSFERKVLLKKKVVNDDDQSI